MSALYSMFQRFFNCHLYDIVVATNYLHLTRDSALVCRRLEGKYFSNNVKVKVKARLRFLASSTEITAVVVPGEG